MSLGILAYEWEDSNSVCNWLGVSVYFFFLVPSSFLMELPLFMTRKLESVMLIFIYHLE